MASGPKEFAASRLEESGDPLEFKIADVTFHAVPKMQARALVALGSSITHGEARQSTVNDVITFIRSSLVPADRATWDRVLDSYDISATTLGDIYDWLIEEYSGRPFVRPATSRNGRSGTGDSSTGKSRSEETQSS